MTADLSAFFKTANWHMADVTAKRPTLRRALAMGRIEIGPSAFPQVVNGTLPKGDVLKLAEIAGVMGAKNTANTIPLCHPIALDQVILKLVPDEASASVTVYCLATAFAKTGVEMEALAGVQAALLTLYDLVKPVEPALVIRDTRLVFKEGGKKGLWVHPDGVPEDMKPLMTDVPKALKGARAHVITLSDRAFAGDYEDRSGPLVRDLLEQAGAEVATTKVMPDDAEALRVHLTDMKDRVDLIVTTGGTGLGERDITCDVLASLPDGREILGLGELLRASGALKTPNAWLSRSTAVIVGKTLIVALPGSEKAVREGWQALENVLPHALQMVAGKPHEGESISMGKTAP